MGPSTAHPGGPPPVRRLTVLHDPDCGLCRQLTAWLRGQHQLVPLEFLAVAGPAARARYPGLDHDASLGEITVVADTGEVWRGAPAFVACLWVTAAGPAELREALGELRAQAAAAVDPHHWPLF
ncbi:hypothetical protein AB0D08_19770, partial [Kitasatospora sp. NPDC048540]